MTRRSRGDEAGAGWRMGLAEMRTRTAARLSLAVLVLVIGAAPMPAQQRAEARRLLVAVEPSAPGTVTLDPIAVVTPHGFLPVPLGERGSDSATDAFARQYFPEGRRYHTRVRGASVGDAIVQQAQDAGCVGVSGLASMKLAPRAIGWVWKGLGCDSRPHGRQRALGREPTSQEAQTLGELARQLYLAHHAEGGLLGKMEPKGTVALTEPGTSAPVLAAAFEIDVSTPEADRYLALLFVAEKQAGAYRTVFSWYGEKPEADFERPEIWDVADVDGDGQAEVVTRIEFYESESYGILRRVAGRWQEVYRGGGGGC